MLFTDRFMHFARGATYLRASYRPRRPYAESSAHLRQIRLAPACAVAHCGRYGRLPYPAEQPRKNLPIGFVLYAHQVFHSRLRQTV